MCGLRILISHAKKVWDFSIRDTPAAAFQVCSGPLLLLAGHGPALSVLPAFEIENLRASVKEGKSLPGKISLGELNASRCLF